MKTAIQANPVRPLLRTVRAAAAAFILTFGLQLEAEDKPVIEWQGWSDDVFTRATRENKFVLLDLGAGWCHWCHVMDEITYADPDVIKLLRTKYLAVRVDQDSRPDLASRYEDYGWPATIVFDAKGGEIVKRQGYLPPKPMASLLQAIIDDPTPGPSVQPERAPTEAPSAALSKDQREAMRDAFLKAYDSKLGGWGDVHKYLNWDALEYCLTEGAGGDAQMEAMAHQTLTAGLDLVDPVWGGVYQYSTDGDWKHPHFEKIMPFQAENLRVFSLAASLCHEPQWLKPAEKIRGFLQEFLTSPEGAFYTSQDADLVPGEHGGEYFEKDDAARRSLGVPRVDQHLYARENGLAAAGLASLYAASGAADALGAAERSANWALANRALADGGFRHGGQDSAGPYLADTLAMGRAFLKLYAVTADRQWLDCADRAAGFIDAHFRAPVGFSTAAGPTATLTPRPEVDENIALARFANLLYHYTGKASERTIAEHALRFVASPAVTDELGFNTAGVLLADREFSAEPIHLTVVGSKGDPHAGELFAAALRNTPAFARLEWYDPHEGPLPRGDVEYPSLPAPAAFLCTNGACSAPIKSADALEKKLSRLNLSASAGK